MVLVLLVVVPGLAVTLLIVVIRAVLLDKPATVYSIRKLCALSDKSRWLCFNLRAFLP